MMMSNITVIIYSYKGKMLKDVVNNLFTNSSKKNNIDVIVIDQHPLLRSDLFEKQNVMYKHVFWDWIYGPCTYKNEIIKNIKTKYTLILSDNVLLSKDWDEIFINFIDPNTIISGNSKIELISDNLFYLSKNKTSIDSFTLNQYIDRSLIFTETDNLQKINYTDYIKYNGEEESLSLKFFGNGKDIYACPTDIYIQVGDNTIETLYVPFSINHNYNEIIDLIQTGANSFEDVTGLSRTIDEFNIIHNNIFKNLKKIPFLTNDVAYSPNKLNFNSIDARKFVARTRAIH